MTGDKLFAVLFPFCNNRVLEFRGIKFNMIDNYDLKFTIFRTFVKELEKSG